MRTIRKIEKLPSLPMMEEGKIKCKRVAVYARVSTDHEGQKTSLKAQKGYYVTCTALELFFAGMDKKDLQEMIERNPADKEEILKLRTRAGEYFTSLDITVNKAALILMNIGEKAYVKGNREPWAVYAHHRLNKRVKWPMIITAVVILAIIYFLFFK